MLKHTSVYTFPEHTDLKFRDWNKTISPRFIVYADFESVLENDEIHLEKHMPIAAGLLFINKVDVTAPKTTYQQFYGPDCVIDFLHALERHAERVQLWYSDNSKVQMKITSNSEADFDRATTCYLCKLAPATVRDHDHFSGDYLGAACSECNLARRLPKKPFPPSFSIILSTMTCIIFSNMPFQNFHHDHYLVSL